MLKIYEADTGIQDYYRVDLKGEAYGCDLTNFQPAAAYRDTDALGQTPVWTDKEGLHVYPEDFVSIVSNTPKQIGSGTVFLYLCLYRNVSKPKLFKTVV